MTVSHRLKFVNSKLYMSMFDKCKRERERERQRERERGEGRGREREREIICILCQKPFINYI